MNNPNNLKNMKSLHQELKEQNARPHKRAQTTPYINHLLDNDIVKESYTGHLRTLAIIYGTLEHQIYKSENPTIQLLIKNYIPKLPYLLKDLENIDALHTKDIIPAVREALLIADKILIDSIQNPVKLIGYIYTLDGSLNGGQILQKHVAKALNLKDKQGLSYFALQEKNTEKFWPEFIHNINKAGEDNSAREAILSGASEAFYGIINTYEHLHPVNPENLGNHITALNPEAGDHLIPTEPLEIEAAIRAAHKTWDEFPYFSLCYDARGKRFAVSDSAWLVTLCDMPRETALRQAQWLSNFLANAGMPTYTFEKQLEYLFQELTKNAKNEKYNALKELVNNFEQKRKKIIPNVDFEKSNRIFADIYKKMNITTDTGENPLKNTGKLIASSLCDAANGMPESKQALKQKLSNPEIFGTEQIAAHQKAFVEIQKLLT